MMEERQLTKLNLGNAYVFISLALPSQFVKKIEAFLHNYKDVFDWSYKELKGIPCGFGIFSSILCGRIWTSYWM
jgi:hypothetical protein